MKLFCGFIVTAMVTVAIVSCSPTAPNEENQVTPLSNTSIDSLFSLLMARVQTIETQEGQEGYTEFTAIDFTSLATGFSQAVKGNPTHVKANIGFMMAKMLALNGNAEIKKMADSLQFYIDNVQDSQESMPPQMYKTTATRGNRLFSTLYKKEGITGLGKAMFVSMPKILVPSAKEPNFPSFVSLAYIQNIIASSIMPSLDSCIDALTRLEGVSNPALEITMDNITKSIDRTDILAIDGYLRMTRAMMGMMTAYDVDLFTSSTDLTYSWIDQMRKLPEDKTKRIVSLRNNALYRTRSNKDQASGLLADVVRANLARTGFLTLRKPAHAKAYEDLKAAPQKIQLAITELRQESGSQENDLIPSSVLLDAETEMIDVPGEMMDNGVSDTLANKFRTPETLMAFINQILSGPFRINETMNDGTIDLTINISAWFTNPVQDLKTKLPKYRVLAKAEQWTSSFSTNGITSMGEFTMFDYFPGVDSLAFNPALISSIDSTSNYWTITLKTPIIGMIEDDTTYSASPIILVDDANKDLTIERINTLIDNKQFFPYFNDYTFNNVFPGMTRQKWLNLIWQ